MDPNRVYRLHNPIQHYAWGSRTALPELLGQSSPAGEPCAELWMGAHPKAPSQVLLPEGSIGLDVFVAAEPRAVLGASVAQRFGEALPFLFKVLAADAPLSIQAHPNLEQARAGFARENAAGIAPGARERCYADANHKPELICALSDFQALNRFRRPEEVVEGLAALRAPELRDLLADLRRRPDREGLAAFFDGLWGLPDAPRCAVLRRAGSFARESAGSDPALHWVAELTARHPGDIGGLAPLLLNVVKLEPGEAMYLPAGELHSYLCGVGLEVMASSDNVLRGGLTPKHVDVPELLRILTFESGPVEVLTAQPGAAGEAFYDSPAEEFRLSRIEVGPKSGFRASTERPVEILLCTAGRGRIELEGGETLRFERGHSFVVPAAAPAYRIDGIDGVGGKATLYRVTPKAEGR